MQSINTPVNSLPLSSASSGTIDGANTAVVMGMMSGITQRLIKKSSTKSTTVSFSEAASLNEELNESISSMLTKDASAPQEEWMNELSGASTPQTSEKNDIRRTFQKNMKNGDSGPASLGIPIPGSPSEQLKELDDSQE